MTGKLGSSSDVQSPVEIGDLSGLEFRRLKGQPQQKSAGTESAPTPLVFSQKMRWRSAPYAGLSGPSRPVPPRLQTRATSRGALEGVRPRPDSAAARSDDIRPLGLQPRHWTRDRVSGSAQRFRFRWCPKRPQAALFSGSRGQVAACWAVAAAACAVSCAVSCVRYRGSPDAPHQPTSSVVGTPSASAFSATARWSRSTWR